MAYTPELSQRHSGTLRRLAWAINKPMTKTLEQLFEFFGSSVDSLKICDACKDQSFCNDCVFYREVRDAKST